jgi:hypothetical protein
MPYESRSCRRAASCRSLTGDHWMNPGHGQRVRSSAGFALVDPSTMSGVDRKVSIRTTLATSLTRGQATAASVIIDVSTDAGGPAAESAAGYVPTEP